MTETDRERQIRSEIRKLGRMLKLEMTPHGHVCALTAQVSLRWALRPDRWPLPSAMAEMSEIVARNSRKAKP